MRTQNRENFTDGKVHKWIKAHSKGDKPIRRYDEKERRLFLQINRNGYAAFKVRLKRNAHGKRPEKTLYDARSATVEQARRKAREINYNYDANGINPVVQKRAEREAAKKAKEQTFAALAAKFMDAPENGPEVKSPRTYKSRERMLRAHILPVLGHRYFHEIKRPEVRDLIRAIQKKASRHPRAKLAVNPGASMANECHILISVIYNWAINEELVEHNPATFKKMFDDTPEKRPQMPDEALQLAWEHFSSLAHNERATGRGTAILIMLCAVTLQRPNEVTTAERDNFDWTPGKEVWRIPPKKNKGKRLYEVPLSPLAVKLFKLAFSLHNHPWAFPNKGGTGPLHHETPSQKWERVREKTVREWPKEERGDCPLKGVQLYDCRRLGRTIMQDKLEVPTAIAEACLNHIEGRRMSDVYYQGSTLELQREAMCKWADWIEEICS